jgi:hypothetical protein
LKEQEKSCIGVHETLSTRLLERFEPLGKELSVWTKTRCSWNSNPCALKSLKSVKEHRPVSLAKDIHSDLHDEIWPYPQNVRVERSVMQLAKRETVRNDGLAPRVCVGQDMGRVEQFPVSQTTHRTPFSVGVDDPLPEGHLMDPLSDKASRVSSRCVNRGILSPSMLPQ